MLFLLVVLDISSFFLKKLAGNSIKDVTGFLLNTAVAHELLIPAGHCSDITDTRNNPLASVK